MINQLLNYPEDSAGSIMTTEYVDLREEMTVGQAMAHIKKTGIHKETIYTCYITERRKLVGIVSAKDLMTTDDDVPIKDLMETEIISVYTHADQEQVAQLFTKYDLLALPVIDQDGRMVGIVTFDDAMDVMVDEATEDITKMAAINPSEKTYFETSVLQHAKNRIPWLLILMFTSIITLGDGLFQQDMIAQLHGLPARSVMVVVLRADDGHVRQARFRQQGSGILEQADEIPFLLRGKVTNGFRALFDGIRRGGNAVAFLLFHGQLHVGARTGTAPDAGEGESLLFRHKDCADNMGREVKERRI